jgi:membrane associated rhomboid family serine protease
MDQGVAWQAHIGGFLAGLLAFSAFDPVPMSRAADHDQDSGRDQGSDPNSTIH